MGWDWQVLKTYACTIGAWTLLERVTIFHVLSAKKLNSVLQNDLFLCPLGFRNITKEMLLTWWWFKYED